MRLRSLLPAISALLLILAIGLPTAQAQLRDLNDRDVFPDRGISIGLPDDEDEDEDEDCPGSPAPAVLTGQSECWDNLGNLVNCAGTGQDGEYQYGVSVDPRFTLNGDGTFTDNLTGLIWPLNASCFGLRRWNEALSDANTLADGLCGLTDGSVAGDWRLPNVREQHTLIDYGEYIPALPPDHPFTVVPLDFYWSSTTFAPDHSWAWFVNFSYARVGRQDKGLYAYALPVRGGP